VRRCIWEEADIYEEESGRNEREEECKCGNMDAHKLRECDCSYVSFRVNADVRVAERGLVM